MSVRALVRSSTRICATRILVKRGKNICVYREEKKDSKTTSERRREEKERQGGGEACVPWGKSEKPEKYVIVSSTVINKEHQNIEREMYRKKKARSRYSRIDMSNG